MNYRAPLLLAALAAVYLTVAAAQTPVQAPAPAPLAKPPLEDLEPAVNTSPVVRSPADAAGSSATPAASAPATDARPRPGATSRGPTRGARAQDRVELEATQITGNRELPKVLYIVPWKRPELGDLVGRPLNSLLDEVLAPVDRDVFRRETRYFDALRPDQVGSPAAPAAPAPAGPSPAAPPAPGSELRSGSQPSPPPGQ